MPKIRNDSQRDCKFIYLASELFWLRKTCEPDIRWSVHHDLSKHIIWLCPPEDSSWKSVVEANIKIWTQSAADEGSRNGQEYFKGKNLQIHSHEKIKSAK